MYNDLISIQLQTTLIDLLSYFGRRMSVSYIEKGVLREKLLLGYLVSDSLKQKQKTQFNGASIM